MAGDRGRDLTFSILSDVSKLELAGPAQDLEALGKAAQDAGTDLEALDKVDGRGLDKMGQAADDARRDLETLETSAKDVDLDRLGTDAKAAARKVDDAFDSIARSSRASSRKVDDDTDKIGRSLDDVKGEAADTAREVGASFSEGGDITDGFQELAANAGQYFGPIGTALGIAGAVGVGLFRAETEALKQRVDELVDYMIEGNGRISEEAIKSQIRETDTGELKRLRDLAEASEIAGVSYRDLARAKVGDKEAQERLNDALDAAAEKYASTTDEIGGYNGANDLMRARVKVLRQEVNEGREALELAEEATRNIADASIETGDSIATAASTAGGAWDDLSGRMRDPITGKVKLQAPSPSQISGVRNTIQAGMGPVIVDVRLRPAKSAIFYPGSNGRFRP